MKNSTKGTCFGVATGLILFIITLASCDASCGESPVYFMAGVLVLVCGFLGAMLGEAWNRKIARYIILAIIAIGSIMLLPLLKDLLG